jgi:hypothetical protein
VAVAVPFIALALTAAGTGVAVASSIEQAKAAEKAGKYNEAVARNNAQAAADQARFEADKIERRNRLILGRQKAAIAKAGILDTGSTLDVFEDSAMQGELDRMAALYSGDLRSGYYQSQGQLARMEGNSAARANYYRAGGSLLSGIGGTASAYDTYRKSQNTGPTFED